MTQPGATLTHWRTDHGMVATDKPLRKRPADDFYPTPDDLVRAALTRCISCHGRDVLDVGSGTGVWGRVAREVWPDSRIVGVESNAARIATSRAAGELDAYDLVLWADFLKARLPMGFSMIVGNPPYQLAEEFVMRSLELLKSGGAVCFLLRLAFMESQGRYDRMFSGNARPGAIFPLVERPSFTGDGRTDATAYAVFVWYHEFLMRPRGNPPTSLHWLSWRKDAVKTNGQLALL
jgi:SAM-dependent methyltransferase